MFGYNLLLQKMRRKGSVKFVQVEHNGKKIFAIVET